LWWIELKFYPALFRRVFEASSFVAFGTGVFKQALRACWKSSSRREEALFSFAIRPSPLK
jgi:hypothetical protein